MRDSRKVFISASELIALALSESACLIDVRAAVEFNESHFPHSVNLPILDDSERAQVGTEYKVSGQDSAIALGHKLVSGAVKQQRIEGWLTKAQQAKAEGKTPVITCARGGMRSAISQQWLAEAGLSLPRVEGGYKALRRELIAALEVFSASARLTVVSGRTGAGKTKFLRKLIDDKHPDSILDLEKYANHRGSAFGGMKAGQPSQACFENDLAMACLSMKQTLILVEDESRMIGRMSVPAVLFEKMLLAPIWLLDEPLEVRIQNTFEEYVLADKADPELYVGLKHSLAKIKNRLGGLRYQEVLIEMEHAEHQWRENGDCEPAKGWIEKLLVWYYDPIYDRTIEPRLSLIQMRGTQSQLTEAYYSSQGKGVIS